MKKIFIFLFALVLALGVSLVAVPVSANPGDGDVTVIVQDQAGQALVGATASLLFYGSPGGGQYLPSKTTDVTGTAVFTQAEIQAFLTSKSFVPTQQVYLQPGARYEGSSIGVVRTVGPNPLVPGWGNDAPSILYNTPGATWAYKPAMTFSYNLVMFELAPPIATWTGTDVTVKYSLAEPLIISPTSQIVGFHRTVHSGESVDYYLGSTTWKFPAYSVATISGYDISGTTPIASLGCIPGDETIATVTLTVSPAQSFSTPPEGVNDQYGNARGSYVGYYKFWNTTLVAEPASLSPDGSSTSTVTATIKDATGAAVADGKSIIFYTSLGSITSPIITSGGEAIATLTAASSSGIADVRAAGEQLNVPLLPPPTEVWVDDAWAGLPNGTEVALPGGGTGYIGYNAFATIQDGINAVAGSTVHVAAGTYNERVNINKSLMLEGANAGIPATGVRGPESIINPQGLGLDFGVLINGAGTTATIDGFTVENYKRAGILAGAFSLENDPTEVHILNNIVTEPIGQQNNNCIQVGDGTTGTIIGNEVSGANLESPDWSGSGILVAGSSNVLVSDNYVHDCEGGIQIIGYAEYRDAPAENNLIENNLAEDNETGISVQAKSIGTIIRYNDVLNNTDVGIGSLALDVSYEHSTPSGTQIHYNNIVGNVNYGVESSVSGSHSGTVTAEEVDVSANWWGDASGPCHATTNPSGTGDAVSDNVDYSPWWGANYIGVAHPWNWYTNDSIQDAVDVASAGDTVNVVAGTYDEQVVIDGKSLTLQGVGDTTIIRPSGAGILTSVYTYPGGFSYYSGVTIAGIVTVKNVATPGVTIKDLKVDGVNVTTLPAGAARLAGILCGNSAGTIDNVTVNTIKTTGYVDRTYGIDLSGGSNVVTVEVKNSRISDFARNGIMANGINLAANVQDNTITGPGSIGPDNVPNGIVFMADLGGTIVHNTITSCHYSGSTWLSFGIMMFDECQAGVVIANNEVYDVDVGIGPYNDSDIYGNQLHDCLWGIELEAGSANSNIHNNDIYNNYYGIHLLGPGSPYYTGAGDEPGLGNKANYNNIYGNTEGVRNWDDTQTFDATYNWWGSSSGPSGVGLGTGDAVSDYVDFEPWLVEVPTVTTQAATRDRFLRYTMNMNYTVGGYSPVQVRFAYKKSTGTEWSYTDWVSKSADGTHNQFLRVLDLDFNAKYDFKAQLKYDDVVDGETVIEGGILQFTTSPLEGCFIATAAYGTPAAEQIDVLREFRDVVLLESTMGSQFVTLYYQFSPPIADFIAGNELLRTLVRELLVDPIVWVVEATEDMWRN